jgi:dTDP-D-glucose 4,6-dehydratase
LHAKDTARAIITIIESNSKNEIYNIAGGFEQSNIKTVEKIINEFYGKEFEDYSSFINFDVHRPGQDVRYALDDSKIRSLGWEPKCLFNEEIVNIVNYYKENFIW